MSGFFSGTRPGRKVSHGKTKYELPILYFRDDFFAAMFTASFQGVKRVLPSDRLHPVTLPSGRALVGIGAYNYIYTSIGPYGEVGVVVPVVHGARAPLPLLPGLVESRYPGFGMLVLHLPVTTLAARDAGRGEWGYPKFVADMQFVHTPEFHQCTMSEEGTHIITLRVPRRGIAMRDSRPLTTYTVRNGKLIKTTIAQRGTCRHCFNPHDATVQLGNHPMAETLRQMGMASGPFTTRYFPERSGILPSGVVLEEGVRPNDGYAGKDREGELEVRYLENGG